MGYKKIISYGRVVEYYEYEKNINEYALVKAQGTRRARVAMSLNSSSDKIHETKKKRRDSVARCSLSFRRLVSANLGESPYPLLATFTHKDNVTDTDVAHANFNAFARSARRLWGVGFRYIAVPETQKRGSIHFHALLWGIPQQQEVLGEERFTRLVAKLWGQGYVDLKQTDGNEKLSTYLSKYMAKAFLDNSLFYRKAYITSRNINRPVSIYGFSNVGPIVDDRIGDNYTCEENIFQTQWLGKGRLVRYTKI